MFFVRISKVLDVVIGHHYYGSRVKTQRIDIKTSAYVKVMSTLSLSTMLHGYHFFTISWQLRSKIKTKPSIRLFLPL